MTIANRTELDSCREEAKKVLEAYDCRILVCSGTGCIATGSEKIYEKMLGICNFTEKEVKYTLPEEFENGKILISNYDKMSADAEMELKPYEAMVIKKA